MTETPPPETARDAPREGSSAQSGQPVLLFVDDDTLIRDLMGDGLRHNGFNVITAQNGPAALAWLTTGQPVDLMITDYAMPEMTGLELIIHVRAARPGLPVVLLSGYADAQVSRTLGSVTAGKGVMLHKPVRLPELAARITAAISGGG